VNPEAARERMVAEQLAARGIQDARVLAAMRLLPRERFVPPEVRARAYADAPLPIGEGQTISQPYMVALMSQALELPAAGGRVLEVGTGSGYQAAVLAEIVKQVYTIEIVGALAERAARQLSALGYRNIEVRVGDGYQGWPEKAPFDAIVVTAAAPRLPAALVAQLRPGGRMVIPLGGEGDIQYLKLVTRRADGGHDERNVLPVRFVPLVPGKER